MPADSPLAKLLALDSRAVGRSADAARDALAILTREVDWLEENTRAIPGEGRAVVESWANVRLELARIGAELRVLKAGS
jgi:hypothetical protein